MNKPLVIYHANCADGFGAAFAAWTVLGDEATYLPWKYSDDFLATCKEPLCGRDIYILGDKLVAIPQGANDLLKNYIILDDNKSGAMLAWEYFHPGTEVPLLIRHIDDYDRWQFKLEGTKAFNKALWSYAPWSFEQWADFAAQDKYIRQFYVEGSAILRAHDQNVQGVVKAGARECSIQLPDSGKSFLDMVRLNGLAANCPSHLTSDVGHELAVQSGTFGLCWTLGKKGMIANCSLRSNGDYDVSAIAKSFGGGGHRNAAGFEVPIETLLEWLK